MVRSAIIAGMTAGALKPGTRVLLIEDDRSISRLLQLELEYRKLAVHAVHDGLSAEAAIEDFSPQVIVLDILLPGMDGGEILRRLRARHLDRPAPKQT